MNDLEELQKTSKAIVRNSTTISSLNILGFAAALLVDILIAARFGLGIETDAFFIAFVIPQFIMSISLVSFNVILVPAFSEILLKKGKSGLWHITNNLFSLSIVVMGGVSVIGILGSTLLIGLLGAGLDNDSRILAISLARIIFLMIVPLGAVEVLKAALNSQKFFAVPASTALLRNITVILSMLILAPLWGIKALAVGYVLAAWFQLGFLGIALLYGGFQLQLVVKWKEENVLEILSQLRYPFFGSALSQASMIFERFLVAFLPAGFVTALVFARRVMRAVDAVIVGGVSTALLPRLSVSYTSKQGSEFKSLLSLGYRLTIFMTVPVTIGIIGLSNSIVRNLYQRGAFDQEATAITAMLLSIYIASIPLRALIQLAIISYFAARNVQTPFRILVLMLGVTLVLQLALFYLWGANGLAMAETFGRFFVLMIVGYLLQRRIHLLEKNLIMFSIKIIVAAGIMLLFLNSLEALLFGPVSFFQTSIGSFIQTGIGFIFSFAIYLLLLLVFGVSEIRQTVNLFLARINKVRISGTVKS